MNVTAIIYQYRFVLVILLLGLAGALLTEKGKLPLAVRGLRRTLQRDAGITPAKAEARVGHLVSPRRRLLAFVLILVAFLIAVW